MKCSHYSKLNSILHWLYISKGPTGYARATFAISCIYIAIYIIYNTCSSCGVSDARLA